MTIRTLASLVLTCTMAAGLAGCAPNSSSAGVGGDVGTQVAAMDGAEVYVVAMHADWCGKCKALGPEMMAAKSLLSDSPAKFVKADLTDRSNPAGKATLENLGLGELYKANKGKTGLAYIIDAQTGKVLGKIKSGTKGTDIASTIRSAIAEAS